MSIQYLTEKEEQMYICEIAELLDGIPFGQARHILNETAHFIDDCHLVDAGNPRFKAQKALIDALGGCDVSPCGSGGGRHQ